MNSLVSVKNIPGESKLSYKNKIIIFMVTLISCLLISLNILQIIIHNINLSNTISIIDVISTIFYFCIILRDIIKFSILEEKLDNLKGFKHDFSNFVQALDGYVKTNNIEGIRIMSKDILKDCASTNTLEILAPDSINNSAVYSIITKKYYLAKEQDILMNIEVMMELKDINISNYHLCRILAILLDNAIEAASKCEGERVVNLKFMNDTKIKRKLIIIENSYKDENISIDEIFEKGFSTKNEKSKDSHGFGLWNVRKILSHKENLNLFTQKGELFLQQLEIYE